LQRFLETIENELGADTLLISCGLPGTGKSTAVREVARIKGYLILSTDLIRREILESKALTDEKVGADMGQRLAVYDEMFRRAEEILRNNDSVILDATFVTRELRKRAATIAAQHNRVFVVLETVCPQEDAIARILGRKDNPSHESNALTAQAYLNNKAQFQKVDVDELKRDFPSLKMIHIVIDTSQDKSEWQVTGLTRG
jgi:uncharacterized protein